MGCHERCIKCGADCCDGVGKGEVCRDCLKAKVAGLKKEWDSMFEQRDAEYKENESLKAKVSELETERDNMAHLAAESQREIEKLSTQLSEAKNTESVLRMIIDGEREKVYQHEGEQNKIRALWSTDKAKLSDAEGKLERVRDALEWYKTRVYWFAETKDMSDRAERDFIDDEGRRGDKALAALGDQWQGATKKTVEHLSDGRKPVMRPAACDTCCSDELCVDVLKRGYCYSHKAKPTEAKPNIGTALRRLEEE